MATVDWQIASLGWDDSPRIDLNVQRREEQRRVFVLARRKSLMIVCIAVYAGAILAPWTMSIFGLRREAQSLAGQVAATQLKIEDLQTQANTLDTREQQWRQYQNRRRERRSWGDALSTIAAACPSDVYLDHMQIEAQSGSITISGSCASAANMEAFVTRMQGTNAFQSVTLTETTTDPTTPAQGLRFKVNAVCNLPLASM